MRRISALATAMRRAVDSDTAETCSADRRSGATSGGETATCDASFLSSVLPRSLPLSVVRTRSCPFPAYHSRVN